MSDKSISSKLSGILAHLHPNANQANIMAAYSQLNGLAKDIKLLEDDNLKLKERIKVLEKT